MGHVVGIHDRAHPGGKRALGGLAREVEMLGHEQMAHGEAQLVDDGPPTRSKVLDGRSQHVVRGGEEGLGVEIEPGPESAAHSQAGRAGHQAVNMQEQAQQSQAQRQSRTRSLGAGRPGHE